MDQVVAWFGRNSAHLMTVLLTGMLLVAATVVVFLVKRLLRNTLKRFETQVGLPVEAIFTITQIITGAIWVTTAILILEAWGVRVGALWAVLASAAATVIGVSFLATLDDGQQHYRKLLYQHLATVPSRRRRGGASGGHKGTGHRSEPDVCDLARAER